ncbi:outer membrane beta-barrel protein [Sphingobacterium suaedae]|uniref:Outer membrane beta-barrel protein n=1 Tax=Sphingobacterium suaedae TaxID=1686402 RepID=A0ABW5KJW3_9SPHI
MKRIILLVLLVVVQYAGAQSIRGIVVDQADDKALENASIVLLDSDSIMRYFTRATETGTFQFNNVKNGEYLLLTTYPKFEIYSQRISVHNKKIDLEAIKIRSQSNLLEEVVINQKIPIKIKGDTIEYDAGSFETEKNAKLEDLLRRLPGLTVSASGEITAQGKTVSKVLIDGEEFFGYDPKIAIRNVRADAVDKVQVYERKSEEAELTGIDDGVRLQTVNVVLKEEARKGVFGNANASIGTQGLFDANLFTAKFNQTERVGVTGNWNNMGNSGDASRIRMNNQIIGNPIYKSAGINYENNFLKKKLHLTSSYNFNNNGQANESTRFSKRVLDGTRTQETASASNSSSDNRNHVLRSQIRYRLDSLSNLNIQLNGSKGRGESVNNASNSTTNNDLIKANEFEQKNSSQTDNENLDLRMDYRRRLNKNGRSVNIHLNTQLNNAEGTNLVDETTNLYDSTGTLERTKIVDQTRMTENKNNRLGASVNISEPITKNLNVALGYSFSTSKNHGLVNAFNNDPQSGTSTIDTLYSKNQEDATQNNGVDVNLNYHSDKLNINISNRMTYRNQKLTDSYRDIDLARNFWQNNLNANISYRISNSKSVNLGYQNNTNVPSFSQLQPLQPPTNELYRQLGNPDLKREVNNTLNINFSKFSLLKASSFNVNASTSFTNNAIVNNSITDSVGRTTATFVNIQDHVNWNGRVNVNYGKPIFNGLVQFGPFAMVYFSNNYEYINGELNNSKNANANLGINANKQNSKIIDFNVNLGIGLNNEANTIQTQLNNTAFRSSMNAELKYFLPYKFSFTQIIFYSYTGKTKVFPEPIQQFYMNLELTRKLLKSESLLLSIKAFDVFNSFNNTNRSFGNNNFSETQQEMLSQYLMVGLKWDFNKNLGKKND